MRPTADRVREALFARLGALDGAQVLDLYAGSGALGIEALSRGAVSAVFVDRAPSSLAALRQNLASLELGERAKVEPGDVARVIRRLGARGNRFELALLDPPYASLEVGKALGALRQAGILALDAMVVIESGRRHPLPEVAGFAVRDQRRYGDTLITRLAEQAAGGSGPV